MNKNGFTKTQNQIIDRMNLYMKSGGTFKDAVNDAHRKFGIGVKYSVDTYLSWKHIEISKKKK